MTAIPAGYASPSGDYPVEFAVDPPASQGRLSVLFRIVMVIPHLIALYLIGIGVGVVTLIAWFSILFTGRYPIGMLRFSINALHWSTRAMGYYFLLTGAYPPFALGADGSYPVRLTVAEQGEGRARLSTFFRPLFVIPQAIVLYFVTLVASLLLLVAWVIALFTGRVPDGIHTFLAGTLRWTTRVNAYALLLTDEYPPFSMS